MSIECYAQRLLNPFRGAMHTIRYQAAEAVTLDGAHWDIYVANERLLSGIPHQRRAQISDIRYGSWSAEKGLKRGPLYPSDDFRRMEEMGAVVYEHLTRVHDQIPFAFRDRYELWLLDARCQPLALLQSALNDGEIEVPDTTPRWRAGFAAEERFQSPAMQAIRGNESAGAYLTAYINRCAGASPACQWFAREPDGSGVADKGLNVPLEARERTLPAAAFPTLFLAGHGHDETHRRLIADFHAWQAPWLLTLPQLVTPLRAALEQQARAQAAVLASQYRLYPEVIDADTIKVALVEAILRRAQPQTGTSTQEALSTYYVELNPSPP